uniref:Uncharacterized protein n=1 Tax=Chromera velia CCMP2878 TaxID=1169474 RepID=A0A0G4G9Y4_9ALVE|eukprot:Cvel_20884.t1-p1 / transcript=Cvel_20884.t1 / gene=Cvel_20884 / organism=Chromera_velia_CCMP2878 / gene_product=hypothetical protein / transcript_product=hypothetical protein / location=Cvel_scaffold1914:28466-34241(-) / protein_length=576 / sequence_SO=supercontig / SO=protein_coding / is_pseudo=false
MRLVYAVAFLLAPSRHSLVSSIKDPSARAVPSSPSSSSLLTPASPFLEKNSVAVSRQEDGDGELSVQGGDMSRYDMSLVIKERGWVIAHKGDFFEPKLLKEWYMAVKSIQETGYYYGPGADALKDKGLFVWGRYKADQIQPGWEFDNNLIKKYTGSQKNTVIFLVVGYGDGKLYTWIETNDGKQGFVRFSDHLIDADKPSIEGKRGGERFKEPLLPYAGTDFPPMGLCPPVTDFLATYKHEYRLPRPYAASGLTQPAPVPFSEPQTDSEPPAPSFLEVQKKKEKSSVRIRGNAHSNDGVLTQAENGEGIEKRHKQPAAPPPSLRKAAASDPSLTVSERREGGEALLGNELRGTREGHKETEKDGQNYKMHTYLSSSIYGRRVGVLHVNMMKWSTYWNVVQPSADDMRGSKIATAIMHLIESIKGIIDGAGGVPEDAEQKTCLIPEGFSTEVSKMTVEWWGRITEEVEVHMLTKYDNKVWSRRQRMSGAEDRAYVAATEKDGTPRSQLCVAKKGSRMQDLHDCKDFDVLLDYDDVRREIEERKKKGLVPSTTTAVPGPSSQPESQGFWGWISSWFSL